MDISTSDINKKLTVIMSVVAAVIIAGGAVFYRSVPETLHFALGVILTTSFNMIKLRMLERTAEKIVHLEDEGRAKAFAGVQYLIRFVLTIAVFLLAAFAPIINVFGAVFGIFTLTVSIYIWRLTSPKT